MKYIGWLIFVIVCFPLGQVFHRIGDLEALGTSKPSDARSADGKQKLVFDEEGGLEVWIDPSSVRPEELPERVVLKKRTKVSSEAGASVVLEQGDNVKVLEVEGLNLVVSALSGPLQGTVAIEDTDVLDHVVRMRAARIFGSGEPTLAATGGQEPSTPDSSDQEESLVASNTDTLETPLEPAPVKEPKEPTPTEPAPTPEPTVVTLEEADIIRLMKESIQAGTLKEFTYDQVEGWKMSDDEEIDGVPYQVGIAAYKAESIFGLSSYQAKALFQNGKLEKWVFAKTGMEIR